MKMQSTPSYLIFFRGLKEEFREITWPTKSHLFRSVFVVCILVLFCIFFVISIDFLIIRIFLFCKKII